MTCFNRLNDQIVSDGLKYLMNMNDNDDPIVGYRAPFNRLPLNYRQSALNAEGIRVMRMLSDASEIESSQADDIKMTILLMYEEMTCIEDENSSSPWIIQNNRDTDSFELSDSSDDSSNASIDMTNEQVFDFDYEEDTFCMITKT